MTTNFDDQEAWNARRSELAKGVHDHMRRQGNVTCMSCHTPASIKPASQVGQVIHASLPKDMACVDCHRNLVHSRPGLAIRRRRNQPRSSARWMTTVHSSHLANYHLQKGMSCSTCHGNDLIPDANATSINAQCATCHGGMEKVAAESQRAVLSQSARVPSRQYRLRLLPFRASGIEGLLPELSHELRYADARPRSCRQGPGDRLRCQGGKP